MTANILVDELLSIPEEQLKFNLVPDTLCGVTATTEHLLVSLIAQPTEQGEMDQQRWKLSCRVDAGGARVDSLDALRLVLRGGDTLGFYPLRKGRISETITGSPSAINVWFKIPNSSRKSALRENPWVRDGHINSSDTLVGKPISATLLSVATAGTKSSDTARSMPTRSAQLNIAALASAQSFKIAAASASVSLAAADGSASNDQKFLLKASAATDDGHKQSSAVNAQIEWGSRQLAFFGGEPGKLVMYEFVNENGQRTEKGSVEIEGIGEAWVDLPEALTKDGGWEVEWVVD